MLTVAEYAGKIGHNPRTVRGWCTNGLITGVVKTRGNVYLIPRNAPIPQLKQGRPPVQFRQTEVAKSTGKTYTQSEMCGFIVDNCTQMTYGQISRELGIPTAEVRRIYDHLHEAYGI